jgi:hypothetical protein
MQPTPNSDDVSTQWGLAVLLHMAQFQASKY